MKRGGGWSVLISLCLFLVYACMYACMESVWQDLDYVTSNGDERDFVKTQPSYNSKKRLRIASSPSRF